MRQQQGMAPARLKLKTLNDNPYIRAAVRRSIGRSDETHRGLDHSKRCPNLRGGLCAFVLPCAGTGK